MDPSRRTGKDPYTFMPKTVFKIRGRTDPGLTRGNNEDNFDICPDLSNTKDAWIIPAPEPIELGDLGCVMVVADGMGGMNAGEVASEIAVSAVKEKFSDTENLEKINDSLKDVERFMCDVLVYADEKINERIKKDRSTEGMGTTMVLAWIIRDVVYVCWCGDSRAYVYNRSEEPALRRLTKDHSYVQQLVDERKLTEDEAFDHPESNIITRCLGGNMEKPMPDFIYHMLKKGDLIMLCTDGLCGVCRDVEIKALLDKYEDDFPKLILDLIEMAKAAGGPDNITVTLLEALEVEENEHESFGQTLTPEQGGRTHFTPQKTAKKPNRLGVIILAILLAVLLTVTGLFLTRPWDKGKGQAPASDQSDAIFSPDTTVTATAPAVPSEEEGKTLAKPLTESQKTEKKELQNE